MKLYWVERKAGQRLVLEDDDGDWKEMGAVRQTRRGFDAFATTNTYDPGRAERSIPTLEEAKTFVVGHRPWELFIGPVDLEVETEVHAAPSEG